MSLLSDTQGNADRIWSLVRLLEANGGRMKRDEVLQWMNPQFKAESINAPGTDFSAVSQTVGAATSLGIVAVADDGYRLQVGSIPTRFDRFADEVHRRLCQLPPDHADYVVLEAYAAVIVLTEKYGTTRWIRERNAAEFSNAMAEALRADLVSDRRFNSTKLPHWVRWMTCIGLAIPQQSRGALYPTLAERLERELPALASELTPGVEHDFAAFLAKLAQHLPYLDGGALYNGLAQRVELRPTGRRLSRVLSNALRDLHDDKRIELLTVGDTAGMYELASEVHSVRAVSGIKLMQGVVDHA